MLDGINSRLTLPAAVLPKHHAAESSCRATSSATDFTMECCVDDAATLRRTFREHHSRQTTL